MHVFFKEKFKRSFLVSFVSLIILLSFASSSFAQTSALYDNAKQSYYSLVKSGKKKDFRHNWENTIAKFVKVTKKNRDPKAAEATFMLGELYRMLYQYSSQKKDLTNAIKYYNKVASKFHSNSLADDSVYKIGEIYEIKLNNYTKAYISYLRVTKEFSKGDMVSKARSKLIKLKKYAPQDKKKVRPHEPSNLIAVSDIKYWSENDSTRIVLYPDESIDYKYNYLKANKKTKAPPRLYIDLFNTKLDRRLAHQVTIKDGLLKTIRSDQHDKDVVRVVLDIESINSYRIFTFENPFRIVIDVSGETTEKLAKKESTKVAKKSNAKISNGEKYKPVTEIKTTTTTKDAPSLAKQLGLGVKKIVIDPGHGGKDPGAVGVKKLLEKNVTLSIAKKLKRILEKNTDCQVILTRDRDTTISLEARTAIAKKVKADIFISIHTNASERKRARGIETYYLNYATDEHAMKTAARENATSKKALSDLEGIVKIIRFSNVEESRELAHKMQSALFSTVSKSYKGAKNLGVKQAPFYVLFGSKKPSILVETSFIDHKVEGKLLASDKYHATLAKAIYNGINEYIKGFNLAKKD